MKVDFLKLFGELGMIFGRKLILQVFVEFIRNDNEII